MGIEAGPRFSIYGLDDEEASKWQKTTNLRLREFQTEMDRWIASTQARANKGTDSIYLIINELSCLMQLLEMQPHTQALPPNKREKYSTVQETDTAKSEPPAGASANQWEKV